LALGCNWLQDYFISHPEALVELGQCQNHNKSLLIAAADTLVTQGEQLAHDGDFQGALAKFKLANAWKPKLGLNPQLKAAPAYVAQGIEKAKDGDFDGAVAKFKQAQQLNPNVDLDPDTQALDKNPKTVAKKLVAEAFVHKGEELASQGDLTGAVAKFKQAQRFDPRLKIPANSWNRLCWHGSLYDHAANVMFACEKAVAFAPQDVNSRDSRGLARALTGNIKGAIEDFEAFIQSTDNPKWKV
jgi:tetratricopeptide (TPR) repeat protein